MNITLDARQHICDWTKIAKDLLNDISLEDVEVSAHALDTIEATTRQMTGETGCMGAAAILEDPFAVRSYWVETTRELILFFWNAGQARAVVIPAEGWMLKSDITVH